MLETSVQSQLPPPAGDSFSHCGTYRCPIREAGSELESPEPVQLTAGTVQILSAFAASLYSASLSGEGPWEPPPLENPLGTWVKKEKESAKNLIHQDAQFKVGDSASKHH